MDKQSKITFYPYINSKKSRTRVNIRLNDDEIENIKTFFPFSDDRCQIKLVSVKDLSVNINIKWNNNYDENVIKEIERELQFHSEFRDSTINFTIQHRKLPSNVIRYTYKIKAEILDIENRSKSKILDQVFDSCMYTIENSHNGVKIKRPKIKENKYIVTTIRSKNRGTDNHFIARIKDYNIIYIQPDIIRLIFTVYDSSYIPMHRDDYKREDLDNIRDRLKKAAISNGIIILDMIMSYNLVVKIKNPKRLTHDAVHKYVRDIHKDKQLHIVFTKMKM